jgi:aminobenzoyl-glutamate utilization protein A
MAVLGDVYVEYVRKFRRLFHSYPEKGWMEYHTAATLVKELSSLGYDVKKGAEIMDVSLFMGLPSKEENDLAYNMALCSFSQEKLSCFKDNKTALSAFMDVGSEKCFAIRFDMDALPIEESVLLSHFPAKEGFSSEVSGVMHSCAHDMHSAIGVGLAKLISDNKNLLDVNILLIFQPAEEGVRGAASIVGSGLLDDVDYLLSSHFWSNMPLGKMVCSQNGTLSTHKFDIVFEGLAAHAGMCPEKGKNALLAAAKAVVGIYSAVEGSGCLINVGSIKGGVARNIVADYAKIEMEVRSASIEHELAMLEKLNEIVEESALEESCSFDILKQGEAIGAVGSDDFALLIKESASRVSFFDQIILEDYENRGCEDFTSMMRRVISKGGQACFMGIGASFDGMDLAHHTSNFDISEDVIAPTLELYYNLIPKKISP